MQDLHVARSLADTLQAVSDGLVSGLGYEMVCVNLVRPDGDLVVASFSGNIEVEGRITGQVGSRAAWDRHFSMGEAWGDLLRFIPYTESRLGDDDDIPGWYTDGPLPRFEDEWHPLDRLFAAMYVPDGTRRQLLGVITVGGPPAGRRPNLEQRDALRSYAFQAAIAISNARLRANMQRALVRLEREQKALRASEESFRQAFEYAPNGAAIAEMGGDQHGRILRTNDALCRLLGRPARALRRYAFSDLVHPEDIELLLRTSAENGRVELRLGRRDGTYVWVSMRNTVVADSPEGPRFLLTHVEDIQERKRRELELAHRASHDQLTGLSNSAELHVRLSAYLCQPYGDLQEHHRHATAPQNDPHDTGLAVVFCALRDFKRINVRFGRQSGDLVLIEVGRRLAVFSREGDTIARLDGDEFVLLVDGITKFAAQDLVLRMQNNIRLPIGISGDQVVRIGWSFSITWAQCGMKAADVIRAAREAATD
ncbi:GGDEF domain-containing protein [Streptomyces sp. YIM 121038]|uniref:GGDEF domain-containing protein n=1 Tax=Streptomyces sp. YIM 121038 TaxID=2136401 RepID=UPI0020171AFF|nr:GGDEF domain-containing protein [Streptomyces sp. YIM 121038]